MVIKKEKEKTGAAYTDINNNNILFHYQHIFYTCTKWTLQTFYGATHEFDYAVQKKLIKILLFIKR